MKKQNIKTDEFYRTKCLTLFKKVYIKQTNFLIKSLKIYTLQGVPPVSEGSHTGVQ